jgi:hypothetical protein
MVDGPQVQVVGLGDAEVASGVFEVLVGGDHCGGAEAACGDGGRDERQGTAQPLLWRDSLDYQRCHRRWLWPDLRSAGQRLPGLPEARGVVTAQLKHGLPLFDAVAGFGQANDPGSRADGVLFAGPACAEKPRGAADRKSVEPAEPA